MNAEFERGKRAGIKWAVSWIHARAAEMNDSLAKAVLNTAAYNMSTEGKTTQIVEPPPRDLSDER